jgi:hypothetical protein
MNPSNPATAQSHNSHHDQRIDETLRRLGSVTPPTGFEDRVHARLAHSRLTSVRGSEMQTGAAKSIRLSLIPRFAFGAVAAALACVAIVAGSVNHSRRILPVAPGIQLPTGSSGIGAASAAHIATRPVSPSPDGRARSVRQLPGGRAVISPQTQKPAGIAVPKTPAQ